MGHHDAREGRAAGMGRRGARRMGWRAARRCRGCMRESSLAAALRAERPEGLRLGQRGAMCVRVCGLLGRLG